MTDRLPIAIVIPWCSLESPGGAENHARHLAEALLNAGVPVEILTTCGRDSFARHSEEYYPAGLSHVDCIPVRRFPLRRPGRPTFFQEHPELLAGLPAFPEREMALFDELQLESDELYAYIWAHRDDYYFVFIPYPYAPTFWGIWLAPEHSFLIPCLHDEPYARYSTYAFVFRRARCSLFNTAAERDLAVRLYNLPPEQATVVSEGVDTGWQGNAQRFRHTYGLAGPFLLYVGRRDHGKRTPFLIHAFCEYKLRRGGDLRLVLAGPNPISVPPAFADEVVDLGYLPEQDKHDALAAATLFVQPSSVESFSLVLMEAWAQGTAALVNGECEVMAQHVTRCGGGLPYRGYHELEAALDYLLARPALRREMGRRGREYVRRSFHWEDVVQRFIAVIYRESGPAASVGEA